MKQLRWANAKEVAQGSSSVGHVLPRATSFRTFVEAPSNGLIASHLKVTKIAENLQQFCNRTVLLTIMTDDIN